jgi:hypothetical protein
MKKLICFLQFRDFTSCIIDFLSEVNVENDAVLSHQLRFLVDLVTLNPIRLTCGFFDINLKFVLSNIAVAVMYIVILCQVELMNHPHYCNCYANSTTATAPLS